MFTALRSLTSSWRLGGCARALTAPEFWRGRGAAQGRSWLSWQPGGARRLATRDSLQHGASRLPPQQHYQRVACLGAAWPGRAAAAAAGAARALCAATAGAVPTRISHIYIWRQHGSGSGRPWRHIAYRTMCMRIYICILCDRCIYYITYE
jgi:hypothetical protein